MKLNPPNLDSLLGALALAALCALQLACLLLAPAAWSPLSIDVRLRPGESIVLGRHELAAPQAAIRHLALRRDADGHWWAGSENATRPLVIKRDGGEQRTGTVALARGQKFQLRATIFEVEAADARAVVLRADGHRWRYDGASLVRDGAALPSCPDESLRARAVAAWNRTVPALLTIHRPMRLGGNLHCGSRLGVPGVAPSSAFVQRADAGFVLSVAGPEPVMLPSGDGAADLARREEPLDQVRSLAVGRTRLTLSPDGDVLRLRPASHFALYSQPQAELPAQVSWTWRARDAWAMPALPLWPAVAVVLAAVLLAMLAGWRAARASPAARVHSFAIGAAGTILACAGLGALVLQRLGMPPGAGESMLLAFCTLWYALLAQRRPGLLVTAAVLLFAAGLLAQLELGLAAPESSWLRHYEKTAALLALGLGAGMPLAMLRPARPVSQAVFEWLVLAATALALLGLTLQVALGDETGVFDLQPVEFAKLALAALTAHCIALALGTPERGGALARWLRLFAPVLLFGALLAVALVQVDDYSPLVLLTVWGASMALAWSLAARRRAASAVVAGLACTAVLAIVGLRTAGATEMAHLGFYADRFMVWLDPTTHPHTGQQLLLGGRAIAAGGWFGADGLLGLSTLGQNAADLARIPAVQDDFAPSFFLNRHGLAGALGLWTLQALFLAALLATAVRAWSAGAAARDYRHAWFARFRCLALCGGAAFVFGHLLLSWGTNLAIFPVMGQPMSFLSAGGSHLLFFICPLLVFGVASANTFEEIR
jgi:cell division protein FtsW